MELIKFINQHDNWKELLQEAPYFLDIKEEDGFTLLKYNQINSDFSQDIVKQCRGIILDSNHKIVCWPFSKFFNWGESNADEIDWSSARVQEKIDGCLDETDLVITNYGPQTIKTILDSKKHYKVLTFNHQTNQNEFQEIEGISEENNDGKQWYDIETEYGTLRLTGNHKVFCINENIYKRVDELRGDEELFLLEEADYSFSNKQKQRYSKIIELLRSDIIKQYSAGVSVNEIARNHNCCWGIVALVLKNYYKKSLRDLTSCKTPHTLSKTKNTNLVRYGTTNVSGVIEIKKKKEATFLKHYGVTNIRKSKDYYDYVDQVCLSRYGKKRNQNAKKSAETKQRNLEINPHYYDKGRKALGEKCRDRWNQKSKEEKLKKLNSLKEGRLKASNQKCTRSKIEKRVYHIVERHCERCKHTFWINEPQKYSYDILFNNTVIIEVNGDFWHANPTVCSEYDVLNLKGNLITAKDIWEKDNRKRLQAENLGFTVIYLWESEIAKKTDDEIWNLIQERINQHEADKN